MTMIFFPILYEIFTITKSEIKSFLYGVLINRIFNIIIKSNLTYNQGKFCYVFTKKKLLTI